MDSSSELLSIKRAEKWGHVEERRVKGRVSRHLVLIRLKITTIFILMKMETQKSWHKICKRATN